MIEQDSLVVELLEYFSQRGVVSWTQLLDDQRSTYRPIFKVNDSRELTRLRRAYVRLKVLLKEIEEMKKY
jgi:hypothetical protein